MNSAMVRGYINKEKELNNWRRLINLNTDNCLELALKALLGISFTHRKGILIKSAISLEDQIQIVNEIGQGFKLETDYIIKIANLDLLINRIYDEFYILAFKDVNILGEIDIVLG